MPRKTGADVAKAKAAKQKKLAIALSVVLALAIAYAVHTMQSLGGGTSASPAPAAVTTTTSTTTPAPGAASPAAPSSATPPAAGQPAAAPTRLVNAVKPAAGAGKLQSFSRFETKDPFAAQGPKSAPPTGSSGSGAASGATTTTTTPAKASAAPAAPPAPPPGSAVLAVNGVPASVAFGADFPVSSDTSLNGIFQLVGLTATTAKVAIAGGSYASGQSALTLQVNKPVTLVNTADGKQYTLLLYPQGTAAPAVSPSGATTTTTTTTPAPGG
ncbi:MAG TPA: hypothetical protein VJ986_11280 [Gaiellaceae bacterium]|nr:hypothetical protein [Gaiellaceae bacterium]